MSISPYRDTYLLKGAALFTVWENIPRRPTRDVDFLGRGDASAEHLADVFRELCAIDASEDGLQFDASSVLVAPIREDLRYGGQRVRLNAFLAAARISLRIDIGFGDIVTPPAQIAEYPTILPLPAPRLHLYPPETVVAEKWQALVELGVANTRLKDFYDLWSLSRHLEFDGILLSQAIAATFQHRETDLPATLPIALRKEFFGGKIKISQWRAFVRKNQLENVPDLIEIARAIQTFLWPIAEALRAGTPFEMLWTPDKEWREVAKASAQV